MQKAVRSRRLSGAAATDPRAPVAAPSALGGGGGEHQERRPIGGNLAAAIGGNIGGAGWVVRKTA